MYPLAKSQVGKYVYANGDNNRLDLIESYNVLIQVHHNKHKSMIQGEQATGRKEFIGDRL